MGEPVSLSAESVTWNDAASPSLNSVAPFVSVNVTVFAAPMLAANVTVSLFLPLTGETM